MNAVEFCTLATFQTISLPTAPHLSAVAAMVVINHCQATNAEPQTASNRHMAEDREKQENVRVGERETALEQKKSGLMASQRHRPPPSSAAATTTATAAAAAVSAQPFRKHLYALLISVVEICPLFGTFQCTDILAGIRIQKKKKKKKKKKTILKFITIVCSKENNTNDEKILRF